MNYEQDRYGSAQPSSQPELRRTRIIGGSGVSFGHDETGRHVLHAEGDGSIALFAGSGAGKSLLFQDNLINAYMPGNVVSFDPRGENAAVSMLALSLQGYSVYCLNHTGMMGLPQHRVNPLDHLTIDSPSLIADAQKIALDFCPTPGGVKTAWSYDDARRWNTDLMLHDAEQHGVAALPGLFNLVSMIQGSPHQFCDQLELMENSRFPSVRTFANEIATLITEGREGFTAPYGVLQNAYSFMRDPRLHDMFGGSDFSFQDLPHNQKMVVFVVWPIEYVQSQSSAIRTVLGSAIQNKFRSPGSIPLSLFVDECGQLGKLESVRELYTFGRGAGLVNNLCAWQEISQIIAAFGPQADEITGSALYRVFKGVRTQESARLVSSMGGTMTLSFDPERIQSDSRRLRQRAVQQMISGQSSMLEAVADLRHYREAERIPEKQSRLVMTPDEVLNMPPNAMVAFASGKVEGLIRGQWINYFDRRETAGKYLPNPYHDAERVRIRGHFGSKMVPMIEERVPEKLAHLPQYQGGTWRYIQGYRPNVGR